MAGVQLPVVRFVVPRYIVKRVVTNAEHGLASKPVQAGVVSWLSNLYRSALAPIHILLKYLVIVTKSHRYYFLSSIIYICTFLIVFKIFAYLVLKVKFCFYFHLLSYA